MALGGAASDVAAVRGSPMSARRATAAIRTDGGISRAAVLAFLFGVFVVGFAATAGANSVDTDLIFDESDAQSDDDLTADRVSANVVHPVSSPLLHHKRSQTTAASKAAIGDRPLTAAAANDSGRHPVTKRKKEKIYSVFSDHEVDVDDEDYIDDGGSSGQEGSGMHSLIPIVDHGGLPSIPPKPVDKASTPVYYRMTINVTSLVYEPALGQRSDSKFQYLSRELMNAVEELYEIVPGQQAITVVKFEPSTPGCLVTVDLGTVGYYDEGSLRNIIKERVTRGSLGSYRTNQEGFSFRLIGEQTEPTEDLEPCDLSEFSCGSNECIDLSRRCNGVNDCEDGSDERECRDIQCDSDQFLCDTTKCVHNNKKCDRKPDCLDGSDEFGCPAPPADGCQSDQFRCNDGQCIEQSRKCDLVANCRDGEDEDGCPAVPDACSFDEFQCHDGHCIDSRYKCDRRYDCRDQSDELNCDPAPAPSSCSAHEFKCQDGSCIDARLACDGHPNCPDYSDESKCPCRSDQFNCSNGICIDIRRKCDGYSDCQDASDERNCPQPCASNEFRCGDGSCIQETLRCNRQYDCHDTSDEQNCERPRPQCSPNEIACGDGSCVPLALKCDRHYDCVDGADERDCDKCTAEQFRCEDGVCISRERRCDSRPDCRDGSDELDCPPDSTTTTDAVPATCSPNDITCGDGTCVTRDKKCNGRIDCIDGVDEEGCGRTSVCEAGFFACRNNECVEERYRCDGRQDCRDNSDEVQCTACTSGVHLCNDGTCKFAERCNGRSECQDGSDEIGCGEEQGSECDSHEMRCGSGECIDARRKCDQHTDCRDGSDETNCECRPHVEFRCSDGKCIDSRRRCNGHPDCLDYSDEDHCDQGPVACTARQFTCDNSECVDHSRRCDGRPDCSDRSDERGCPPGKECQRSEYRCHSGQCIESIRYCDGHNDCLDASDEHDCALRGTITLRTYPDFQTIKQGREVVFQCRDEGSQRAPVKWSRVGHASLPVNATDIHGRLTMPGIQVESAGTYVCSAAGVIPAVPPTAQRFVNLTVEPFVMPTSRPKGVCDRYQATCQNGDCVPRQYVCDGDMDCKDGSDETGCRGGQSRCEPNEFQCDNRKCILKIWRCDGDDDCGDNSDEHICAPSNASGGHCQYKEYKCQSLDQCIPKSFQCDGEVDCQDNTDEIGCGPPTIVQPPTEIVMVSVGETVTLSCRAIGVPTPFISWRLNWGHIPPPPRVTSTSDDGHGTLTIRNTLESDAGAYSCEAINSKGNTLATPDTQLTVKPIAGVCQPPLFNSVGKSGSDCIRCFCFGHAVSCFSSGLHYSRLPHGTEISVIAASTSPAGSFIFDDKRYVLNQDLILHLPESQEFKIDDRFYLRNPSNIVYYWSLPSPFLGSKLHSYGGYLRFSILYRSRSNASPVSAPDVVIKGNGITLYYRSRQSIREGSRNDVEVQYWEGAWYRLTPTSRGDGQSDQRATREDIMMVLHHVDNIWLRASYVTEFSESSLISLSMDVAIHKEDGFGRAVFVEQCTCPDGYTGLSCEACAPGYLRVSTGSFLGECRRGSAPCECHGHSDNCDSSGNCYGCQHNTEGGRCERCVAGYYGDGRRGTPNDCQRCACPLTTGSNQFSRTCFLDTDGSATCNDCNRGYIGRKCEKCAAGYYGDPTIPGQGCTETKSQCDPIGSISLLPDPRTSLCHCKDYVAGPTCSQCQPDKFHLNEHSLGGCVNCFCMGVTSECGSSALFRNEETATFTNDRLGFSITNLDLSHSEENNLRVNSATRELNFRDFSSLTPGKLYFWRLPAKFLGNKVTSYGGSLSYTLRYSAASQGTQNPGPDVQIMGNRITLDYYHSTQPQPYTTETVSVPLFERYWKRSDGQPATREHLMMALANLEVILIKAMYYSNMLESNLKEVTLLTSVVYNNGKARAVEVEQCRCPIGYKGTSCEECDIGYARTSGGLYLGLCEPCFCNSHSSDCDPDSGTCRNCQHNTTGDLCEQCLPGYYGDASRGSPYDCSSRSPEYCHCVDSGTVEDTCAVNGKCVCKSTAAGDNCNECLEGYFNLDARNPDGCSKCYCSGATDRCSSSSYFRTQIRPSLRDVQNHGFMITDRYQSTFISEGIVVSETRNEVVFRGFLSLDGYSVYYLALPAEFTGNRLNSYGGRIKFTLKYTARGDGRPFQDSDIIIHGSNQLIYYTSPTQLRPDSIESFDVQLTEPNWQSTDTRVRAPITRDVFMSILANVQGILVRVSHSSNMLEVVVGNVQLDSATPQPTGQDVAGAVESCDCPPGYIGLSCEACAPGYVRDHSTGSSPGQCIGCNCHGHSDTCDPHTKQCQRCRHNTIGTSCERCAEGYYGDPTVGTPDDCRPCPCPLSIPSNQFTRECYLDSDGLPTCQRCPAAYTGRTCDQCSVGYAGNPKQPGDSCRPRDRPSSIIVQIQEPKHQQVSEGDTITLVCIGYSQVRNVTYNVAWTREDGRALPTQAQEAAGTLTIRGVRNEDSGTYVCTGSDLYGVATDKAVLRVSACDYLSACSRLVDASRGSSPSAATVQIEPRTLEVAVGQPVEFRCSSEGFPRPNIQWTRGYSSPLNPFSTEQDGVLRIPTASKSDEGEYYCTASNSLGSDRARAILFVREDGPPDRLRVTIMPSSHDARVGETVRFDCRVEGATSPTISWTRVGQSLPAGATQIENMLVLSSVDETFRGVYVCSALTREGSRQAQSSLNVLQDMDRPTARIEPEQQNVPQGSTAEIRCITTGEPTPTVQWIKAGEELPTNHQIVGSTLRILSVNIHDRGIYVCQVNNKIGSSQASAILEVERREPPAVELYPGSSQTIPRDGSALFQCRVTAGAPAPEVEWTREDRRPFAQNVEILNGGVIRFNRVSGDEQGRYVCTARNIAGTVTAVVTIVVQGLPEISISPASPYTVSVGQNVRLECWAKGEPTPSVYWRSMQHRGDNHRGYQESFPIPGRATLEISQVQLEDAGYYECTAQSSTGLSTERVQLIVTRGLNPPAPYEDEFVVHEGNQAELRCSAVSTVGSQVQVQWVRADRRPMPSEHTIRDGTLTLYNIQKQDAGEFVCLGMVNGTVHFSVTTRVIVVAPPRLNVSPLTMTARPGERATFRCQATGDDPINIDWQKVTGAMSPSVLVRGGDLVFQGVSVADAGRYVCTARNHVGQAEGVVEVYVNEHGCRPDIQCTDGGSECGGCDFGQEVDGEHPVAGNHGQVTGCTDGTGQQTNCDDEAPNINVPQKNQTVFVGSTVDLVCDAYGQPPPNIIWKRDRGELPVNSRIDGNVLRIMKVRVEDGGRYICTASNDVGSSQDFTILNVQGISSLSVHIEPNLGSVKAGDNLDVRCITMGDNSAVVSWYKVGGPLPSNARVVGDTLRVTNVNLDNGGIYRCQVSSFIGSYQEDYVLSIQSIPALPQNSPVKSVTAALGTTASVDCAPGDSSAQRHQAAGASYSWSKQGGVMPANASISQSRLLIPDVNADDAGTYLCTARSPQGGATQVPVILTVSGVVPYFAQAPASFITLPTLPDAYLTFEIEISFKPETQDGLLLYNGQQSGGGGDFISLGLSKGFAEFRFDVGSGPAVLRSERPLDIGKWHTIRLSRTKKEGTMTVRGQAPVNGTASGRFQGLDLIEPLYVGGVKDFSAINRLSGFSRGFVGCISRFLIGNTVHELSRDAVVKVGVTTCETCAVNPCTNEGVCQEALSHSGYKCICLPGFSGMDCEKIGESCFPGACGAGRCEDKPDGFQCYCPYGKTGRRCDMDINIYEAAFRDDAYVAYPTPKALKKHKFALRFKPRDLRDGIILYCAQTETGAGDFVSIAIKDKKVEFRFDTGSGPAVLRSSHALKENEWVTAVAERSLREGTLAVNQEEEVRGKSPGHTRGLNLRTPLYVGGVDKHRINLSPFIDVAEGFDGCIAEVEVGDVKVDMVNALIDSSNVDNCGGHTPCERQPCLNGGECKETGSNPTNYECVCEEGFAGKNCEEEEDICNVISPCANGGSCVGTGTSYRCRCPIGYSGNNCDRVVEFVESAGFQGHSYLELSRELLPHTSSTVNENIDISFETTEANGLILWHGQKPDTDGKGQDYLSLAVVNGYLVFGYELGSGPANIKSSSRVDDGKTHRVVLKRMGRDGSMELDDIYKEYGESQGILQMLNTRGNIYLGGLPNAALMTAGQHTNGFIGCIHDLDIQLSGVLNLMKSSVGGANVTPCDSNGDEDYSGFDQYDNQIPK